MVSNLRWAVRCLKTIEAIAAGNATCFTAKEHPFSLRNHFTTFNYNGFPGGVIHGNWGTHGSLLNYGISMHFPYARVSAGIAPSFRFIPELNWPLVATGGEVTVEDVRDDFEELGIERVARALLEHLASGYLCLHLDKYYIPRSRWFLRKHYQHDVIIVGMDPVKRTVRVVQGFDRQNEYLRSEMKLMWLLLAIKSRAGWDRFPTSPDCMRHFREPIYKITVTGSRYASYNVRGIKESLHSYVNSKPSWSRTDYGPVSPLFVDTPKNGAYGLSTYKYIAETILMYGNRADFDFKITKLLWEHKQLMVERLTACRRMGLVVQDADLRSIRELESCAVAVHLRCLKTVRRREKLSSLKETAAIVTQMKRIEYTALADILANNE